MFSRSFFVAVIVDMWCPLRPCSKTCHCGTLEHLCALDSSNMIARWHRDSSFFSWIPDSAFRRIFLSTSVSFPSLYGMFFEFVFLLFHHRTKKKIVLDWSVVKVWDASDWLVVGIASGSSAAPPSEKPPPPPVSVPPDDQSPPATPNGAPAPPAGDVGVVIRPEAYVQ